MSKKGQQANHLGRGAVLKRGDASQTSTVLTALNTATESPTCIGNKAERIATVRFCGCTFMRGFVAKQRMYIFARHGASKFATSAEAWMVPGEKLVAALATVRGAVGPGRDSAFPNWSTAY